MGNVRNVDGDGEGKVVVAVRLSLLASQSLKMHLSQKNNNIIEFT